MNKLQLIIILALSLFLFTNCEKPEECIEYKTASVIEVQGPTNAEIGKLVTFDVKIEIPDGCGEINRFVILKTGTITKINATSRHTGCNCSTGSKIIRTTFSYKWTYALADAQLHFFNAKSNNYTIHKIEIINPL